ncbi:His-Xaa-Ser system protein HxsD [Novisyntrophococcus fermenticellae]|uniref:His-Xaa-Ser system protein HxsD n=1 Tax=Novisyntrophococcus fermenticellae TaxID=2068655 RepID=UPI001E35041A|nr:His-Xaa-Ser system protein HxsD [Novisyntrophococcus fermenticellae]
MKSYIKMINREMYPKSALLKASYAFIKDYYIHLEQKIEDYIITITSKDGQDLSEVIPEEFENELLAQTVRNQVYSETHSLREILMARAMASTMVMSDDPTEIMEKQEDRFPDERLDFILEDWFDHE